MTDAGATDASAGVVAAAESLAEWIAALAGPSSTPAGGALALATLAGAAALGGKIARIAGGDPEGFANRARRFLEAADEDARGYGPAARAGGAPARAFLERGLGTVRLARGLLSELETLRPRTTSATRADLDAATGLVRASAEILLANLDVNLLAWEDDHPGWTSLRRDMARSRDGLAPRMKPDSTVTTPRGRRPWRG